MEKREQTLKIERNTHNKLKNSISLSIKDFQEQFPDIVVIHNEF